MYWHYDMSNLTARRSRKNQSVQSIVQFASRATLMCLIVVAASLLCSEAHAQLGLFGPSAKEITVDQVIAKQAEQQKAEAQAKEQGKERPEADFVIVDVRTPAEYSVSMIPGAITKAEFEKNQDKYKGKTVIAYCLSGGRSGRFANELAKNKVDVLNFKGSILGWCAAELPLVKKDGSQTYDVNTMSSRYQVPDKYNVILKK